MPSLRSLRNITFVGRRTDKDRVGWLQELTARAGQTNVFNVSVVRIGTRLHVAWRALPHPDAERPFRSYYTSVDLDGGNPGEIVDLTAHGNAHGVTVVADPKLFVVSGRAYVTFNTGSVKGEAKNDIYVMRVAPELCPPQRCVIRKRRRQEKNWVFFVHPDGGIGVVYQVEPLILLKHTGGTLGRDEDLKFWRLPPSSEPRPVHLHALGTQLYREGTSYYGIVHEKRRVMGRLIYMGRPATFTNLGRPDASVRLGRARLVHSWGSLLPHRRRHNPRLFSATYFSGITKVGGEFLLGYGINDKRPGIVKASQKLWS